LRGLPYNELLKFLLVIRSDPEVNSRSRRGVDSESLSRATRFRGWGGRLDTPPGMAAKRLVEIERVLGRAPVWYERIDGG